MAGHRRPELLEYVVGELSLDSSTQTTISTQDTWTAISGSTSTGAELLRVSSPSAGELQYDGSEELHATVNGFVTATAPAGSTFAVAIAKNGTAQPTSETQADGVSGVPIPLGTTGAEDLMNGDTLSLQIKNIDGTGNITVEVYNLVFTGVYVR